MPCGLVRAVELAVSIWQGVDAMKLIRMVLLTILLLTLVPGQVWANDDYDDIINSLMCPTCMDHGEILANGSDGGAESAKEDIRQRLASGQTKEQIIADYVAQYGEQILAVPGKTGFNMVAWVLPPLAAIGGTILVFFVISNWVKNHAGRNKRKKGSELVVDSVDEERLNEEMRKYL